MKRVLYTSFSDIYNRKSSYWVYTDDYLFCRVYYSIYDGLGYQVSEMSAFASDTLGLNHWQEDLGD